MPSTQLTFRFRGDGRQAIWPVLLVVLVSSLAISLLWRPWLRPLSDDWAYRDLEAMRIRRGEVYYRDFFMHKAPLASYLAAGGQAIAAAWGAEPLLGTRVVSILLTGFVAALVAWAWANAEGSRGAGALAGLAFGSMAYVGMSAAAGMEPKTGMVGAGLAAILAARGGRWTLAGACAGLAALFWQPGVMFLLALAPEPLVLARRAGEGEPWARALRAAVPRWLRMGLGFAGPLALAAAYFGSQGALSDAWQQAVVFNLGYAERYLQSVGEALRLFGATWLRGHGHNLDLLVLGAIGLGAYLLRRGPNWPAGRPLLTYGALALVLSLINIQDPSDTVPLLPVLAPGAAVATFRALRWLSRRYGVWQALGPLGWRGGVALAAAALLAFGALDALAERLPYTLQHQRADLRALVGEGDPSPPACTFGLPEAAVLRGGGALCRYPHLYNGVAAWVGATQPGGLREVIGRLEAQRPGVVLVAGHPRYDPDYAMLYRWLEGRYELEAVRLYVYYYLPEPAGFSGALLRLLVAGDGVPALAGLEARRRAWVWRRGARIVAAQGAAGDASARQPPR